MSAEPGDQEVACNQTVARDRSLPLGLVNFISMAGIFPCLLLWTAFIALWGHNPAEAVFSYSAPGGLELDWPRLGLLLGALVAGIVAHEGIHALVWTRLSRQPFSAMRFGFDLKTLTPYAHLREAVDVQVYRKGTLAPGLLLGAAPLVVGLALGWGGVFVFGLAFSLAAVGDALVWLRLRDVPAGKWVRDHPARAGCWVLERPDQALPLPAQPGDELK